MFISSVFNSRGGSFGERVGGAYIDRYGIITLKLDDRLAA